LNATATTKLLRLESDCDAGVPSRLLDLLTAQHSLPERLTIDWHPTGISIRMDFVVNTVLPPTLIARLRMIPGVRAVGTAALS
jgi:hypothetical protein